MKKFILACCLFSVALAPSLSKTASSHAEPEQLFSLRRSCIGAALFIAGVLSYPLATYIYNSYQQWLEDQLVDALTTALIPMAVVDRMMAHDQERILRKKAQLICMRKRILLALADYNTESADHNKVLNQKIKKANLFFATIDFFRRSNPYQDEYKKPHFIEKLLEQSLIESIIACTKPAAECSAQELAKREHNKIKRDKIIARVINNLKSYLTDHFKRIEPTLEQLENLLIL